MSSTEYERVVRELCDTVGLPSANDVLEARTMEVDGFHVRLDYFDNDLDAMYVNFHFGTVTAGRTLVVFRLMLEANLLVYAQDQAQLGLDSDTGGIVLIVRVVFSPDLTGPAVADLMTHYSEHGRYWRTNIVASTDEMFEGIAAGTYLWLRA